MSNYILADGEYRLLSLIWDHAPIPPASWYGCVRRNSAGKKSTTYTQVRRLADKGLLQNEQSVVTPLVSRDQVQREESDRFVSRTFGAPARLCGRISEGAYPERIGGRGTENTHRSTQGVTVWNC